jgi:GT2 family glycosyltransferase
LKDETLQKITSTISLSINQPIHQSKVDSPLTTMDLPHFSIIIPTYARPQQLTACLHALTHLNYPRDRFDVIVVDDGSPMALEPVVEPWRSQLNLMLLRQPNAGPSAARNYGAMRATGEFLAFTDDDCATDPEWLSKLAAQFQQTPDRLLGGYTTNALTHNPYASMSQLILDGVYAYYNAIPTQASFFASNNLALPADRFRQIGGFDERFRTSEDRELCDRWLHQGHVMTYVPEAIIVHAHDLNLSGLWNQHFSYGQGAFQFHALRSQRGSGQFAIEHTFYLQLMRLLFSARCQQPLMIKLSLFFIAQLANLLGFFEEKSKPQYQITQHVEPEL